MQPLPPTIVEILAKKKERRLEVPKELISGTVVEKMDGSAKRKGDDRKGIAKKKKIDTTTRLATKYVIEGADEAVAISIRADPEAVLTVCILYFGGNDTEASKKEPST